MQNLITNVVRFLDIKKPYSIELKSRKGKLNNCAQWQGYVNSKKILVRHVIKIYLPMLIKGERNIETLIIHELIHAWQEENGHNDIHGKSFQRAAKKLQKLTGYSEIYLSDVDE